MSDEIHTDAIVKILEADIIVLRQRTKIISALGIEQSCVEMLEGLLKTMVIDVYKFWTEILKIWISKSEKLTPGETILKLIQILKKIELRNVAEKLEEELLGKPTRKEFGTRKPVKNFIGRIKELETLSKCLLQDQENLLAVVGLGGMGKSELLRKLINDPENLKKITTLWLCGEDEDTLKQTLIRVSANFSLSVIDKEALTIAQALSEKIVGQLIVVIDNVEERYEILDQIINLFLEREDTKVILTSRLRSILEGAGKTIQLGELEDEDAIRFVANSISESKENVYVSEICKTLQNFPLALQQAVSYINVQKIESLKGNSYNVYDYMGEYKETAEKLLKHYLSRLIDKYEKTTLTTWKVTTDKIKNSPFGSQSISILDNLSFMNPDSTEVSFLAKIEMCISHRAPFFEFNEVDKINIAGEILELNILVQCLTNLKKYSMINIEDNLISIHRLVQQVTRIELEKKGFNKLILNVLANWAQKSLQKTLFSFANLKPNIKMKWVNFFNILSGKDIYQLRLIYNYISEHKDMLKVYHDVPGLLIVLTNLVINDQAEFEKLGKNYLTNLEKNLGSENLVVKAIKCYPQKIDKSLVNSPWTTFIFSVFGNSSVIFEHYIMSILNGNIKNKINEVFEQISDIRSSKDNQIPSVNEILDDDFSFNFNTENKQILCESYFLKCKKRWENWWKYLFPNIDIINLIINDTKEAVKHFSKFEFNEAFTIYNKYFEQKQYIYMYSESVLEGYAECQLHLGNEVEADIGFEKLLKITREHEDSFLYPSVLQIIGKIYLNVLNFNKAKFYFSKLIIVCQDYKKSLNRFAITYNDLIQAYLYLGSCYLHNEEYIEAEFTLSEANKIASEVFGENYSKIKEIQILLSIAKKQYNDDEIFINKLMELDLIEPRIIFAELMYKNDKPDNAIIIFEKLLKDKWQNAEMTYGNDILIKHIHAKSLFYSGYVYESQIYVKEIYEILYKGLGEKNPLTKSTKLVMDEIGNEDLNFLKTVVDLGNVEI